MPRVRNVLNNNSMAATLVAVLILVVALIILYRHARRGYRSAADVKQFYLDTVTEAWIVRPLTAVPPIITEDGHEAVLARVFDCGDCSNPETFFLGYLEKFTEEAQERMLEQQRLLERDGPDAFPEFEALGYEEDLSGGLLFAAPTKPYKWVPANTPEADAITSLAGRCESGTLRECRPR